MRNEMIEGGAPYLSHIDNSHSQSFVTQDGSILVAFPPLQHDLQSVGIPLQKMGVLKRTKVISTASVFFLFFLKFFHN